MNAKIICFTLLLTIILFFLLVEEAEGGIKIRSNTITIATNEVEKDDYRIVTKDWKIVIRLKNEKNKEEKKEKEKKEEKKVVFVKKEKEIKNITSKKEKEKKFFSGIKKEKEEKIFFSKNIKENKKENFQGNKFDYNDFLIKTKNIIKKFEWFRGRAYFDVVRWSIWYGTPSYAWETITREEAERRLEEKIFSIYKKYTLWRLPTNVAAWVASFVYNVGAVNETQKRLLFSWQYESFCYTIRKYVYSKWKYLKWLAKRREAECALILQK